MGASLLALLSSALAFQGGDARAPVAPITPAPMTAADAVHAFAADLLREAAGKRGNFFCSPLSFELALAMTRAGARGETAQQMDAVLHLPPDASRAFHEATKQLAENVLERRGHRSHGEGDDGDAFGYELAIANGLFVQKDWTFELAFRSTAIQDFGADCREVDFANAPAARAAINGWVDEKTAHKIQDIVPPDLPTPDTRMALVNAIHFKAAWAVPFPDRATADAPFTVEPGRDVTVRMMAATHAYALRDDALAQGVELPYRDGMASLVVVLPKARDGLDALVASLTPARLAELTARGKTVHVALKLPKFTFTTALEATPLLRRLGMVDACDPVAADFSGITLSKRERPFIGQVLHKAFVAVDEKGTEAAAATVVLMRAGSAAKPEDPVVVNVDHPFLFFIRHEATGQLLFAGRVDDPTAK
jgi:serpin B